MLADPDPHEVVEAVEASVGRDRVELAMHPTPRPGRLIRYGVPSRTRG